MQRWSCKPGHELYNSINTEKGDSISEHDEMMKSAVKLRIVLASITLITLAGAFSLRYWSPTEKGSSFSVYYTAACLVRSNMNLHLYDGVERGVNPQLVVANPATTLPVSFISCASSASIT
jgi:hypothetical protein